MPATYRQVVVLRYFQELSSAEIGSLLGQPIPAVRMRLYRARQRLAQSGPPEEALPEKWSSPIR